MRTTSPATYAVLPIRRRVVFPGQVSSFAIGKPTSIALIEHVLAELEKNPGRMDEHARAQSQARRLGVVQLGGGHLVVQQRRPLALRPAARAVSSCPRWCRGGRGRGSVVARGSTGTCAE